MDFYINRVIQISNFFNFSNIKKGKQYKATHKSGLRDEDKLEIARRQAVNK